MYSIFLKSFNFRNQPSSHFFCIYKYVYKYIINCKKPYGFILVITANINELLDLHYLNHVRPFVLLIKFWLHI